MGSFVHDHTALAIVVQINARFGAGDPIEEMAALQKEFKVFSSKHTLQMSFALLNIAPPQGKERERWYRYLRQLHSYTSDMRGVDGHDRVVRAAQKNLESAKPLPMRLIVHSAKESREVKVTVETPIIFSKQKYLVVSVPTAAGRDVRKEIAEKVRARRKASKPRQR